MVHTSPPASGRMTRSSAATAANADAESEDGEGPRVHARGPDVIGMEDMGPQVAGSDVGGLDIEGALGRRGEGEHAAGGAERRDDGGGEQRDDWGGEQRDGDGDVVIADADGVSEGADEGRRHVGGDAVDSSSVA